MTDPRQSAPKPGPKTPDDLPRDEHNEPVRRNEDIPFNEPEEEEDPEIEDEEEDAPIREPLIQDPGR